MGGNVFEGTVPLLEKHKIDFINLIKRNLEPNFLPYPVGSAGNFGVKTESYNDVDFVIEADDEHWAKFVSFINDTYEEVKKITNQCYSVAAFSPYTDEYHQVDFMRSKDLLWSVNAFHSPYGTSKYKSAHRNILLMAMIKVLTVKEYNVGDRIVRTRQHLDLYDGLVYMVQSKSKTAIRYATLDKITISMDFMSAIMRFIPVEQSAQIDSFESVYTLMHNHFWYKHTGDRETWFAILAEAKDMIISAKLKMPTEIAVWIEVSDD